MIVLGQNQVNNVFFTLRELTTIDNPNYILQVKSNSTNKIKNMFLGTNISQNKARFDIFEVKISESEDLDNAVIDLEIDNYDYRVFETTGTTYSNDLREVESGLLEVTGSTQTNNYKEVNPTYTYGKN